VVVWRADHKGNVVSPKAIVTDLSGKVLYKAENADDVCRDCGRKGCEWEGWTGHPHHYYPHDHQAELNAADIAQTSEEVNRD
jgi:hypothetical protein